MRQTTTESGVDQQPTERPSSNEPRTTHRRSSHEGWRRITKASFAAMCTWIVVALMVVESALGLAVTGLYPEADWAVAALRGNDLITLILVAPVLGLAVFRAPRSDRWTLVWASGLLYGVYNFAYYAFGTAFSDVFLLHVASLSLSIIGLIALVSSTDATAMADRFDRVPARRLIAGFMVFVGCALITAWGGLSVRFAITGQLPEDVMPPTAVHLVYALDLSLLAPAFLVGGVLLWRNAPWGYLLGVAVNLFGAAYLVVLEVVGGFEANAGIADKSWWSPPAVVGAVLCLLAGLQLLRHLHPGSSVPVATTSGDGQGKLPTRDQRSTQMATMKGGDTSVVQATHG